MEFHGTNHVEELKHSDIELCNLLIAPETGRLRFVWDVPTFEQLRAEGRLDEVANAMQQQADWLKMVQQNPAIEMTDAGQYLKVKAA